MLPSSPPRRISERHKSRAFCFNGSVGPEIFRCGIHGQFRPIVRGKTAIRYVAPILLPESEHISAFPDSPRSLRRATIFSRFLKTKFVSVRDTERLILENFQCVENPINVLRIPFIISRSVHYGIIFFTLSQFTMADISILPG